MKIPFRIKRLTETAKLPTQENEGDLFDLYADGFCAKNLNDTNFVNHNFSSEYFSLLRDEDETFNAIYDDKECNLKPQGRILVKTGIAIELPKQYWLAGYDWLFKDQEDKEYFNNPQSKLKTVLKSYAVADLRPRSGLALKHGITILNSPATIDNSYRKELGVILYNAGHEPYTISKGDKIAQMLIRPLYPSSFEEVKDFEDTGRGGFGSTGK